MIMTSKEWNSIVFVYLGKQTVAVPAGALRLKEEGPLVLASTFGYGKLYLTRPNAFSVDPSSLPLEGAVPGTEQLYEPINELVMFGAIRDAMPDAWGRRVIENKLKVEPNSLSESDYLEQSGANRFGALDFRKDRHSPPEIKALPTLVDLPYLLEAADRVQNHEQVPEHLRQLFDAGPSMGGARPKAVVRHDDRVWLAKFDAKGDSFDVPGIEQACLELARNCGLSVPETRISHVPGGKKVMLIERFDRERLPSGEFSRRHVVSALTLMGLHESESPSSSYAAIARKIAEVGAKTKVASDSEELFGRMVFNILVGNDDDHLRNHAFVWDDNLRGWMLSPLYDVIPKPQQGTDRFLHLSVGSQGRLATLTNALSQAGQFGILPNKAKTIVERISLEVREWRTFFEGEMGVARAECDKVSSAFRKPSNIGGEASLKGLLRF
jgi:serine/threonine-protein kinase HipA